LDPVVVVALVLFLLVVCGGGGLLVIAMLVLGIVLLRREGDDVTVRRAVTVGAESMSQAFRRTPSDAPPEVAAARAELGDRDGDVVIEHTTAFVDNQARVPEPEPVTEAAPRPAAPPPSEGRGLEEAPTEASDRVDGIDDDLLDAPAPGLREIRTSSAPRARKLLRVGFFAELDHGGPDGDSLRASRNESPQPHEARIVAYLRSAPVLVEEADSVADVLDPDGEWIGPPSIHTDGVWAWPADLAYYVEHYHVTLPTPFVEHVVDQGYQVGAVDLDNVEL